MRLYTEFIQWCAKVLRRVVFQTKRIYRLADWFFDWTLFLQKCGQNIFIKEYASLKKLGITEAENYIKNISSIGKTSNKIWFFATCCIGEYLLDEIENSMDESLAAVGYCDFIVCCIPEIYPTDGYGLSGRLLRIYCHRQSTKKTT